MAQIANAEAIAIQVIDTINPVRTISLFLLFDTLGFGAQEIHHVRHEILHDCCIYAVGNGRSISLGRYEISLSQNAEMPGYCWPGFIERCCKIARSFRSRSKDRQNSAPRRMCHSLVSTTYHFS